MKSVIYVFATTLLLSLSACGGDVTQWSEEVQLHDGKVITLKRRSTLGNAFVPGGHRALIESWELCYEPLKAYWRSNEPFQPIHFDIANGEAYVKVPMRGCEACKVTGSPKNSTLYLVLRGGRWQGVPEEQYPDKRWKNIVTEMIWNARRKEGDIQGHWTVAKKWERDDVTEDSPYGAVVRRKELSRCERCRDKLPTISTNLKLIVESAPIDAFCKQ